jgi:pimeloyl-ACP methyl ester carboxylesterase
MRIGKTGWLVLGAISLAVLAARRVARDARMRRERLRRGELTPLSSVWREVGGVRMHAHVAVGAGSDALPVVLVHGFGVSSSYLTPTAERLGTRFDVYAPDLPGHGRSDTPQRAYNIEALANALIAWMSALRIERAALVANSMGCQIAVAAALADPGRVDRLVLIGPTLDPIARNLVRLLARFVWAGIHEDLTLGVLIVRDYARMGARIAPELCAMLEYRMEDRLREVDVPTLLVRGEHDAIAPRAWLARASKLIGKHARWTEVKGAAHAVNYSAPDALVQRISRFLE